MKFLKKITGLVLLHALAMLFALAVLLGAAPVHAATVIWQSVSGNWSDGTKGTGGVFPAGLAGALGSDKCYDFFEPGVSL